MKTEFTRAFEKQVDQINNAKLKTEIANAVRSVIAAKSLHEIANIKKLKGAKAAYRIRTGNYSPARAGFQNNTVYFMVFAHRKDIYRNFP